MKKQSPKTIRTKLDHVFSKHIRARDTDPESGKGWCISCGKFTELEAGHFIRRQHASVRWDERNVNGQCAYCNRWLHGNEAEYYVAMVRKYGQSVVDELMRLKRAAKKHSTSELKELLERYQGAVSAT